MKTKRLAISIITAISLLVSLLPMIPVSAADVTDKVIASFNYDAEPAWPDLAGFTSAQDLDSTTKNGATGSSMKYTIPSSGSPLIGTNGNGSEWDYGDLSAYNALKFWVKANNVSNQYTYIRLAVGIQNATDYSVQWLINGGAYHVTGEGAAYGNQSAAPDGYGGGIVLYPGYEGWVTIPFSSLNGYNPANKANTVTFVADAGFNGWEIYIDDITLTNVAEDTMLLDFDDSNEIPTCYLGGAELSLVTSPAASGNAVKGILSSTASNDIAFNQYTVSGWKTDWASAGNALTFWVSAKTIEGNPDNGNYKVTVFIEDGSGNRVSVSGGAAVFYGDEQRSALADGGIYITPGDEGYISIPYTSFANTAADAPVDFSAISMVLFNYGAYFGGNEIYLDEICLTEKEIAQEEEQDKVLTDSGLAAITVDGAKVIQDFENITAENAADYLNIYAGANGDDPSAKAEITDAIFDGAEAGKSWKVTTIDNKYGTLQIYNTGKDLSGTNALRFYVRYAQLNSKQYNYFKLENIRIDTNNSTVTWRMDTGAAYYFVDMEGNRTPCTENGDGTYAVVLSGEDVEGYIEIPYTSLVCAETGVLYSESNPIALDQVNQIVFCLAGHWFMNGSTVYIDSVAAVPGDYPIPEGEVIVTDNAEAGFVLDAETGVFPYDTTVTVTGMDMESNIAANLMELLEEEDALDAVLYSITSVRTQNAGMASSNKTGTMVQVSFAVPNGYKNPKVVQFIEGMAVVMPSTVEDGVVTALLPIFATGSYAVADFEEAPPADDDGNEGDDSENNGNGNENQEESPDTGASLALLPIVGLVVSGLTVSLSKKRSSK